MDAGGSSSGTGPKRRNKGKRYGVGLYICVRFFTL
jgi:hypothetical protein